MADRNDLPETDQHHHLAESRTEEVGEVKLEIEKIRRRVTVIKAFHCHVKTTNDINVRNELLRKVDCETDTIMSALSKIADLWKNWSPQQKSQVAKHLTDVIDEYRTVIETEKQFCTEKLHRSLKEASSTGGSTVDPERGILRGVNYMPLTASSVDIQLEIEEQYTKILQANKLLQRIGALFPEHLVILDDLGEDELFDMMKHRRYVQSGRRPIPMQRRIAIWAALAATTSTCLVILLILKLK